ncbi:MAG: M23 family metallopeptidase [Gammaproteobacteria bacterium]|nr:M23 family metallopeptidase [Gammaproteobacteria bacterium]
MQRALPRTVRAGILVAAVAAITALPAIAQVYRYRDEHGNWVYTDRPPAAGQGAEALRIKAEAASPRIVVEPRSSGGTIDMIAVNECLCVVEFAVKTRGADGRARAAQAVVPQRSRQVLLEVPAPPGTGTIAFDYGYVIGDPGATHQPRGPYRAPFAVAQSFTISQAPPDAATHRDAASRNAIDIAMPVGTPVHAAREGLVINVAHRFFRGGLTPQVGSEANFVQVLHDDGTTAVYAHLQMDTIRVRPGQRVERGQYIANSGNTGYSSGPHLHFVVLRNAGLHSESLPVAFAGPGGSSVVPRTGGMLTAY